MAVLSEPLLVAGVSFLIEDDFIFVLWVVVVVLSLYVTDLSEPLLVLVVVLLIVAASVVLVAGILPLVLFHKLSDWLPVVSIPLDATAVADFVSVAVVVADVVVLAVLAGA